MPRVTSPPLVDAGVLVQATIERVTSMPHYCPLIDGQANPGNKHSMGFCGTLLMGLMAWTLLHGADACASEATKADAGGEAGRDIEASRQANAPRQTADIGAAMARIPASYRPVDLANVQSYSAQEFRPHGRSLRDNPARTVALEQPLMSNTTVWQRLSDYRNHDRLSLVTLWETGGNSVSIQAGRRGDPTLQWTSRLMNRPGAARGLLDELFSTSVGGLGKNIHFNHPGASDGVVKNSGKVSDPGLGSTLIK